MEIRFCDSNKVKGIYESSKRCDKIFNREQLVGIQFFFV